MSYCYAPNTTDCTWYSRCLARRFPCRRHQCKYSIRYARRYCEQYSSDSLSVSDSSSRWIDAVRQCVQMAYDPLLHRCQGNPSYDEIEQHAIQSYESCFTSPPNGQSVCDVDVKDWFRIFWKIKDSLTTSFASIHRTSMSSSLRCGGAFQQQIGNSFYSITLRSQAADSSGGDNQDNGDGADNDDGGKTDSKNSTDSDSSDDEKMTDDELAHLVATNISNQLNWQQESTVDWYAFSVPQSDGTFQLQLFFVDRVDVGLMDESEVGNRSRLDATITQLTESINSGLVVGTGRQDSGYEVTGLRQCTSGVADPDADCSDGTVLASTGEGGIADWFRRNQNAVIGGCVVVAVVFAVAT